MKTMILIFSVILFSFTAFSQESTIPLNVKNSFAKKYPDMEKVKWDKEGKHKFEASFIQNRIKTSVILDEEGEIEETETQIRLSELPSGIIPYINSNYKDFKISEAAKIVDEDGNVNFEAEISSGSKKQDLLFDKLGNPVQKKSGSRDNEKEDEEDQN